MTLELNATEVAHLLTVIWLNEREGTYSGQKLRWLARSKRLAEKLAKYVEAGSVAK